MSAVSNAVAALQALEARTRQTRALLRARVCREQHSGLVSCQHGAECKEARQLLSHVSACPHASCVHPGCIDARSALYEWDGHRSDALRRHCLRCRYAIDEEQFESLSAAVLRVKADPAETHTDAAQQHVAAALQPAFRLSQGPSQQQALNVLRGLPSEKTRAARYQPGHVHLSLLLASATDREAPLAAPAAGIALPVSAAALRVAAELAAMEAAAAARVEAGRGALLAGPSGATREGKALEAHVRTYAETQASVIMHAAALAERVSVYEGRVDALKRLGASADSGRQLAKDHPKKEWHTVLAEENALAVELQAAQAHFDVQSRQLETLRDVLSRMAGAPQQIDGGAAHAAETSAARRLVQAGVCAPGGAALVLRIADRAHSVGSGVLLAPRPSDDASCFLEGAWSDKQQKALLDATGASRATAKQALSPATVATIDARTKGQAEAVAADPALFRRLVAAEAVRRSLDAAQPLYTGSASATTSKGRSGGAEPEAGAVAYMRDLLTTHALHVLSGVVAVSRARQGREIAALTIATRLSAAGGHAPSSAAPHGAPASSPPPGLVMPAEVRDSGLPSAAGLWSEVVGAWEAWYASASARVAATAQAGLKGPRVQGSLYNELVQASPTPDSKLRGAAPSPATGPVLPLAFLEHQLRVTCSAVCREVYELTVREQLNKVLAGATMVEVAAVTPALVASTLALRRGGREGGSSVMEVGMEALRRSVPVTGDGRLALPAVGTVDPLLRDGVNSRVTAGDVLEYLQSQLNGGGGATTGVEAPTDLAAGLAEGEWEAPLRIQAWHFARRRAGSAASGWAEEAEGGGVGEDVDMDDTGTVASVPVEEDKVGAAAVGQDESAAAAEGGRKRRGGHQPGKYNAMAKGRSSGGGGAGEGEHDAPNPPPTAPGGKRKRPAPEEGGGSADGGRAKKGRRGVDAGTGAPDPSSAAAPAASAAPLDFLDPSHPLAAPRVFEHLPGRVGTDAEGGVMSRGELDRRVSALRKVAPRMGTHPREAAWMRASLAKAQERRVLGMEASDLALQEKGARFGVGAGVGWGR